MVVNCDEGDPGAYMDRSLMEGNPYGVLEGLIIGAYAIGAHEGYFYVRQEYPLALENLGVAIRDGPRSAGFWEKISSDRGSISTSRCIEGQAPLSAARKRR